IWGIPACCGVILARREIKNSQTSARLSTVSTLRGSCVGWDALLVHVSISGVCARPTITVIMAARFVQRFGGGWAMVIGPSRDGLSRHRRPAGSGAECDRPDHPAPDLPSSASSLAGPRPREVAVKIRPLAVKKS